MCLLHRCVLFLRELVFPNKLLELCPVLPTKSGALILLIQRQRESRH